LSQLRARAGGRSVRGGEEGDDKPVAAGTERDRYLLELEELMGEGSRPGRKAKEEKGRSQGDGRDD